QVVVDRVVVRVVRGAVRDERVETVAAVDRRATVDDPRQVVELVGGIEATVPDAAVVGEAAVQRAAQAIHRITRHDAVAGRNGLFLDAREAAYHVAALAAHAQGGVDRGALAVALVELA